MQFTLVVQRAWWGHLARRALGVRSSWLGSSWVDKFSDKRKGLARMHENRHFLLKRSPRQHGFYWGDLTPSSSYSLIHVPACLRQLSECSSSSMIIVISTSLLAVAREAWPRIIFAVFRHSQSASCGAWFSRMECSYQVPRMALFGHVLWAYMKLEIPLLSALYFYCIICGTDCEINLPEASTLLNYFREYTSSRFTRGSTRYTGFDVISVSSIDLIVTILYFIG